MAGKGAINHDANKHFGRVRKCCIVLFVVFNIQAVSSYSLSRFYSTPYLWLEFKRNGPNAVESGFSQQQDLNTGKVITALQQMRKPTDCRLTSDRKCNNNIVVRYFLYFLLFKSCYNTPNYLLYSTK